MILSAFTALQPKAIFLTRSSSHLVTKRWFVYVPALVAPFTLVYDAPFGRFATPNSILAIDGIKSWIVMEIPSPLTFLATLALHPFSRIPFQAPVPSNNFYLTPQALLAACFLTHYANRALISPLRSPSRSSSHPMVVLSAFVFNIPNGFMMAAYLSATSTTSYLSDAFSTPRFWLGIAMWLVGFAGNIIHDEILYNLRRKASAKGKGKEEDRSPTEDPEGTTKPKQTHHYSIPHDLLYKYISYPNYFCEWVEWLGFALAASPGPSWPLLKSLGPAAWTVVAQSLIKGDLKTVGGVLGPFADSVNAPWAFLLAEVFLMLPRAMRGHWWYHEKFGESYPKERKAVIPFLL